MLGGGGKYSHKSIIHSQHKHLPRTTQLVTQHVTRDVGVRAARRESSGDTDDEALAGGEFLGEVDFVARGVLEDLD
jgi:hypothetical protein